MKHPVFLSAVLFASCLLLLPACDSSGPEGGGGELNPDLVRMEAGPGDYPFWWMGAWTSQREIYATAPLSRLHLSDSLALDSVSTLIKEGPRLYVEANAAGTKLLFVNSLYLDVALGTLVEMDTRTGQVRTLRDSTYAVSSALYWPGDDSKLVYYSYGYDPVIGNPSAAPGYHLFDTRTGADSLLFRYRSELGPAEVINGFDVSPDGRTLIYPVQYDWQAPGTPPTYAPPPKAVEYDLQTGARDTLELSFETQILWLRYSPDGRQLLYCNYERGAGGYTFYGPSEFGVVDRPTFDRRILDVDAFPDESASLSVFPNWSPSGQHIVFGSAPVFLPSGAIGHYTLWVLKNVN